METVWEVEEEFVKRICIHFLTEAPSVPKFSGVAFWFKKIFCGVLYVERKAAVFKF